METHFFYWPYEFNSISYNQNTDHFFKISDLHFMHKNILNYNYRTRKQFIDYITELNHSNKDELLKKIDTISENNKEQLNEMLCLIWILQLEFLTQQVTKFYQYLVTSWKEIKNLYYIDQWDFIFHLTQQKLDSMKKYWLFEALTNYFKFLKTLWFKTYLTIWNHDNFYIRYNSSQSSPSFSQEIYSLFFDHIEPYYIFEDTQHQVVQTFTHFPLLSSLNTISRLDKHDFEFLVMNRQSNRHFDIILPIALFQYFVAWNLWNKKENRKIIMNYWHVHDANLINTYTWKQYNQKIDYSDYSFDKYDLKHLDDIAKKIKRENNDDLFIVWSKQLSEVLLFFDTHVELQCNCFDHIYNNSKSLCTHITKE